MAEVTEATAHTGAQARDVDVARPTLRAPSRLMKVALARQIAGDAAYTGDLTRSQLRIRLTILGGVFAVIAALVLVLAQGGIHLVVGYVAGAVALLAWAHALWGDQVSVAVERAASVVRMLFLLVLAAGCAGLVIAATAGVLASFGAPARTPLQPLLAAAASIGIASVMAWATPAFVSISNFGYAAVLRILASVLWFSSVAVTLLAVVQVVAAPSSAASSVNLAVSAVGPILGFLGALRNRHRAMSGAFAHAIDDLVVLLATQCDRAELMRAFQAVEREAAAGGVALGRRGSRLVDRHIGVVLAVCAQQLTGLPPHIPDRRVKTVIAQMSRAGIPVEGPGLAVEALAFAVAIRDRLADA